MWVLLPLKDFVKAKQRLSGCLNVAERRGLFQSMVEDVLDTLARVDCIERIVLLSDDPAAHLLANCYGADCWSERELGVGLNPVIEGALDRIAKTEPQVEQVMIVHGDLPLINPAELDEVFHAGDSAQPSLVVATDRCGRGSNVLLMSMTGRVPLHYGPASLNAHLQAARERAIKSLVLHTRFLAMDIDTRDDLLHLIDIAPDSGGVRTMKYLQQQGLIQRLQVMQDIQSDRRSSNNASPVEQAET